MKKNILYATLFVSAHYIIGIGSDYLLSCNIHIPSTMLGIACLCLWTWISYSLYDATKSIHTHVMYLCLPVFVLFLAYVPFVRILIINLPLIYIAPVFVIATSIAARFTLPITVWTVISIAVVLMVICAYLGASAKKSIATKE